MNTNIMLQNHATIKYDRQHFDDNGPKLINRHGDWGVFIAGEQVDGPYFSRQDAMTAYALAISEQAEAEQIFAGGIEWDDIPFEGEPMGDDDGYGLQVVA